jgi:hypothetical protein
MRPRPQPQASATLDWVYSYWRWLGKSMCPSGGAVRTNPGNALTTRLNSSSEGAFPDDTPQDERAPLGRRCLLHLSISLRQPEAKNSCRGHHGKRSPDPSVITGRAKTRIPHAASVISEGRMSRLPSVLAAPSDARGMENENVAPGPSFSVAHRRP